MRHVVWAAALTGILGGGIAVAGVAPAPPSTFTDSIVVSTSLAPEARDEVTASVTVVDEEEIAARQATNLSDLLKTIPGLALVQSGSPGQQTSLFTRGTSSVQTLLLWNGLQLNEPYFGGANWQFVPTDGVSRVEVVRSPASALYGSNALGGVVQVLTGTTRNAGTVRVEGGSHGYRRGGLTGGWNWADLHFDVAGHIRRGEGEFKNDSFDSEELLARALWSFAPGTSLGLLVRGNNSDTGIPFSGTTPTPERRIGWQERELAIPFQLERGNFGLDAQLSEVRFENTYRNPLDPYGFTATDTSSAARRGRTVATWQADPRLRLSFGGETERLEVTDSSSFGPNLHGAHQRTWAVFGQAGWSAGPLHADLGLRRDDNDVYGGQTSLRTGGVVDLGAGWRLRASYGEAFRAPTLGELYFPGSGNPDLQPESGRSTEVGLEGKRGGWSYAVTAFESRQRNLIEFDFATFANVNVGRAKSRGLEAELGLRRGIFTARLNATWLDAQDEATGLALLRRARRSANVVVSLTPGRWTFALTGRSVADRPDVDPVTFERGSNPGYQRLDLAASWQLSPALAPYVKVDNVTDRSYAEALGFPAPGRTVIGGLAVHF